MTPNNTSKTLGPIETNIVARLTYEKKAIVTVEDLDRLFNLSPADRAYQNAIKHSDKQNARIEHDKALQRVIMALLSDHTELFKQFSDNPSFKKWLSDTVFRLTYADRG